MYGRDRIMGPNGEIPWIDLIPNHDIEARKPTGKWKREYDCVSVEDTDGSAHVALGGPDWVDYEISMGITPVSGEHAFFIFRAVEPYKRFYVVELNVNWKAMIIKKADHTDGGFGLKIISAVNFDLMHGRKYELDLAARGASLTTYIDGKLVNQVTDWDYDRGGVMLCAWHGVTKFYEPKIRLLQGR